MAEQLHSLDSKEPIETQASGNKINPVTLIVSVIVIFLAIFAGRTAAQLTTRGSSELPQVSYTKDGSGLMENKYGEKNEKLCPDNAEGKLKKGGVDGEGTHHLERKGGKSQNVYLTSSTVDLSLLIDRNVKVWGKTYSAQAAGWLMDVCYLEVK